MIIFRLLPVIIIIKLFGRAYALLHHSFSPSSSLTLMQSFDFSSAAEWDKFYKTPVKPSNSSIASEAATPFARKTTTIVTEWHSTVPLDEIASVVPSNAKCLIIGCGNSNLPDRILQQQGQRSPPKSLVLFDSSQTCLDQLRNRFQNVDNECNQSNEFTTKITTDIEYICGDATKLTEYFSTNHAVIQDGKLVQDKARKRRNEGESLFDIIIDKGLTDAILCGEGWDGPLEKLLHESANMLSTDTGRYLLISYQLPSSTKNFLMTVGEKIGLEWEFDVDLAELSVTQLSRLSDENEYRQASVAVARKTSNYQALT